MTTQVRRLLVILAVPIASVLIASAAFAAQRSFDRRFEVAPGGQLTLDAGMGSVAVTGRDGSEVVVHAEAEGSRAFLNHLSIRAEQDSSSVTVTVRARRHGELGWLGWFDGSDWGERRLRITIEVPHDWAVTLKTAGGSLDVRDVSASVRGATSGGSIRVQEVMGPVRMHTSGGSILVREVTGPVSMHTSGGSIHAEHLNGNIELGTSGGGISIADVSGDLEVHTSGSGIRLENIDARVRATTSGGSIHAEARSNRGITLDTSGGTITLMMPATVRASVDASTSGGRVSTDLPVTTLEQGNRSQLRGEINGGGEPVVLHTSGGSIRLGSLAP